MKVRVTQYKWAGSWGPFRIKTPCGECSATESIVKDVIEREFRSEPVAFEVLPWLDHWPSALLRGGWHAPVVMVNGRVVAQGAVLDRGLIAYHIRKELARGYTVPAGANIVFSKPGCQHCVRAKALLRECGVSYEERDIIANPLYAHQMFALAKNVARRGTPVTTPQIWLDGAYVGGADDLERALAHPAPSAPWREPCVMPTAPVAAGA